MSRLSASSSYRSWCEFQNFTSSLVTSVCRLLHVQKVFTTPYHPQCNGMVKRFNRTLIDLLSKLCASHSYQWENYLPLALFAYRMSVHASTGYSPFYIVYGHFTKNPFKALLSPEDSQFLTNSPVKTCHYITNLKHTLQKTIAQVKTSIDKAQVAQKNQYNPH